ncbi:hypothetical protein QTP88_015837 [Uroleucon formosanum]
MTEIRGNTTSSVPLDDTLFLEANFALSDGHGNWNENTYIQKTPKACSAYRNLMGVEWTRVMNGLGIKNATCPVPSGIYIAPGLDTSIFTKNTNIPKTLKTQLKPFPQPTKSYGNTNPPPVDSLVKNEINNITNSNISATIMAIDKEKTTRKISLV